MHTKDRIKEFDFRDKEGALRQLLWQPPGLFWERFGMLIAVVLLLSVVFVVFSIVFGIRGWRGGWISGMEALGIVVACAVVARLLTYPLSSLAERHNVYYNLKIFLLDAAARYGVVGITAERVLSSSLDRTSSILIFVLIIFILLLFSGILRSIIKRIWKKHSSIETRTKAAENASEVLLEAEPSPKDQKVRSTVSGKDKWKRLAGVSLGVLSAALICIFLMTLPGVNLIAEARRVDTIISFAGYLTGGEKNYPAITGQGVKLVDVYFDTKMIAGDEEDKLELMNRAVRRACSKSEDVLFQEIGEELYFENRAQISRDMDTVVSLATLAEEQQLTEVILTAFRDGGFAQLAQTSKMEELTGTIYSFSFSGTLVRMIMTEGIRAICGDKAYIYPAYIDTAGTQEAFQEILNALPSIAELAQEEGLKNLTDTQRQDVLGDLDKLRKSALLPPEVFAKILNAVR